MAIIFNDKDFGEIHSGNNKNKKKKDKLDVVLSLVRASRDEMANNLIGEFCPVVGKKYCEECSCDECWDRLIKSNMN